MKRLRKKSPLSTPLHRERGQGMLEYILIVVFVVIAGIVVWRIFGDNIKKLVAGSGQKIQKEVQEVKPDETEGLQKMDTPFK